MRRRTGLWLVLASLLATSPTAVSASEVSDYDRFQLWYGCLPMDLVVEGLNKYAADIGLTKEAITVAVRSRLRAARLYETDAPFTYLYVNVNVVGLAYNIYFTYNKWVTDHLGSDRNGFATTWSYWSTGTHGKDSDYILSDVRQHTDRFIDEYLRVNADACD